MKYIAALALFILPVISLAETSDAQAKQALRGLLSEMRTFNAQFAQVVTDADDEIVHKASGKLSLQRPDKLRWQTVSPDETLLIADGDAVWNIDHFVEQVTVISQQQAIANNPVILLTSNDAAVWDKFIVTAGTADGQYTVTPENPEGQISALTLTFDGDRLMSLKMTDSQSQHSLLTFSDITVNQSLNGALFRPAYPDSYILDDQR